MTAQQPDHPKPTDADEGLVADPTVTGEPVPTVDSQAGDAPADPAAPEQDAPAADDDADTGDEQPADADGEAAAEAAPPVEQEPDWKDRYLRSVAELDNVRKRARRDAAAGEIRGVTRLAKELLPAIDNLDRAIQHVDETSQSESESQIVDGLRIVHRELHAALSQAGIEAYDPTGEEFDPRFHEAMTTAPAAEGVLPGTVTTVYQVGYRRGDDVIRAAKVVVAG